MVPRLNATIIHTAILLGALLSPLVAQSQTAAEIARRAFPSTVLLVLEDAAGRPLSLGSGFFVRPNEVATNHHVIAGASRGYAKVIGQPTKYAIEAVAATDARNDVAIIKIVGAAGTPLTLGNSEEVEVGETVYAVGNPQGLEGTFSQGIISGLRSVGSERFLQLTAPISPGSSGGPVLNAKGEVVGISVATYKGGQNLNFAVPVSVLKRLLEAPAGLRSLEAIRGAKGPGTASPEIGSKATDAVLCETLTWEDTFGGSYAISIRNMLRENVRNVQCLIIFHDQSGKPIDVDLVRYGGTVPAGLAKRVSGKVHSTVQELTTPELSKRPRTRIEFRTLDFQLVN